MAERSKPLSIVTVHLENFAGLSSTLSSLESLLGMPGVEWIVVDGGSKPGDAGERRIMDQAARGAGFFISEPDRGIYDAMNKGMRLATGDYVLFLNAGDRIDPGFDPGMLAAGGSKFAEDMIWGQTRIEYPDGRLGVRRLRGPRWAWYGMPVCHQSVLFSRDFFGGLEYDTQYPIAADYELLLRALKAGASVRLLPVVISEHASGGLSQRDRGRAVREESRIRAKHFRIPRFANGLLTATHRGLAGLADRLPAVNRTWRKWI